MKNLIIFFFFTILGIQVSARKDKYSSEKFKYKNTAQIELMGHGAIYSLNYERSVVNLSHAKTSFQIGAGYLPPSTGLINFHFPVCINELISFTQHHIECGIGASLTFSAINYDSRIRDYDFESFLTFKIGYRYQKPNGRMQYKILFTPVIEYEHHNEFTPWGGLTIGYNF